MLEEGWKREPGGNRVYGLWFSVSDLIFSNRLKPNETKVLHALSNVDDIKAELLCKGDISSMMRVVVAVVVAVLLLSEHAVAIFEDQAGQLDWYKPFVGPVTSATLHRKLPRLFLGTQRNVVGSLQMRDGSIAWRRLLEEGDTIDATQIIDSPSSMLLSLSGNGSTLRAWDQVDGSLKWQLNLHSIKAATPALDGTVGKTAGSPSASAAATAAISRAALIVKYEEDGSASEVVVLSHGELKVRKQ